MTNANNNTITIATDSTGCTVSPGTLEVNTGDDITIINQTDDSASVLVANEKLFKEHKFTIDSGSDKLLTVESVSAGDYPYAVFCRQIDDFAHASSMPIIVVRR